MCELDGRTLCGRRLWRARAVTVSCVGGAGRCVLCLRAVWVASGQACCLFELCGLAHPERAVIKSYVAGTTTLLAITARLLAREPHCSQSQHTPRRTSAPTSGSWCGKRQIRPRNVANHIPMLLTDNCHHSASGSLLPCRSWIVSESSEPIKLEGEHRLECKVSFAPWVGPVKAADY